MAFTISGSLAIDETSGVQGGSSSSNFTADTDVGVTTLVNSSGAPEFDEFLSNFFTAATSVSVSNASSINPFGTALLTGLGDDVTDLAFTDSLGAALDGDVAKFGAGATHFLRTVDGAKIFLYSYAADDPSTTYIDETNVVLGRKGAWNVNVTDYVADPNGALVFAAYLQPTDASGNALSSDAGAVGAKVWLVEYEPIDHGIDGSTAEAHDDARFLFDPLYVTVSNRTDFSLEGAPSGQNLFLMFGTPGDGILNNGIGDNNVALVVTGKNPINQSDPNAGNLTSGDTVNTGQGGGGTTLGTNNQMIDPTEGMYFTFVKDANPNYTVPNLDQNEADVEANIAFTGLFGATAAIFSVSQMQPPKAATLKITALSTAYESGVNFIDGLSGDSLIAVNKITITAYTKVGNTYVVDWTHVFTADGAFDGRAVDFLGDGTVKISGVEAKDSITYETAAAHNRVLIDNAGNTDANLNAAFDIGGFSLISASRETGAFQALSFQDDGPTASLVDAGGSVTIDETAGNQDDDNDATAVSDLFDTEVTVKGTDLSPTEFAISSTALVNASGSGYGADGAGTTVLSLAVVGGNGTDSLLDTTDGKSIFLYKEGDLIVGRYDADGNGSKETAAFAIALQQDGKVATAQYVSLDHPTAGSSAAAHDDQVDLAGFVNAVVTVTDLDGDTSTATVGIGDDINFDDDGPSASLVDGGGSVTIDETAGNQDDDNDATAVSDLFDTEVTTKGTDLSPAEFAISSTALVDASGSSYRQDEEGGTTVLSLAIVGGNGTDSLLDTTDGKSIFLYKEGDLIVGRYDADGNGSKETAAFAIALLQDGNVATAQYVSLFHPITTDHDDRKDLTDLVNAVVTVTDGDGDTSTASFGIGDDINFDDDGPSVSANSTVLLDDDALTGGNAGGTDDDADSANVSGTLGHAFGQDEEDATVAYLTTGAPAGFSYELSGTSLLVKQGTTTVLTLTMVAGTGAYTVVQNNPILHAAGNTENNQSFTINYRVTDGDGDTADGTLGINVDDDTPVVTAKSNLIYANTSNAPPVTDVGGTGVFAYSIGADKHVAPYSATNSDFLSVTLTGGTVGSTAITDTNGGSPPPYVEWASESATQAVFNVAFTYVSNSPNQGDTSNATGTLTFDKVADTYTLKLDQEIESFSILKTSTAEGFTGYEIGGTTPINQQPPVSVAELAEDFWVQFNSYAEPSSGTGTDNLNAGVPGVDGAGADDAFVAGELFFQAPSWVSVSQSAAGVAGDTIQQGEVMELDFFVDNPFGDTSKTADATSKAIFLKFDGIGSEDLVVVLKLIDASGNPASRTTRAFVVDNEDIIQKNVSATSPIPNPAAYGIVLDNNDGAVIFESNDYNFDSETYVIEGAQVLDSTEGITGSGYNFNGFVTTSDVTGDNNGATLSISTQTFQDDINDGKANNPLEAGEAATWDSEPIKIIDIGFVTDVTPDAHLTFDVVVTDADGDATATQTLDVTIVGGDGVTASADADTFVIGDTDVDGLLSMVMTVIDGGFATGIDKLDFSVAGSGANYTENLVAAANLAAFTAAADAALTGAVKYYFGVVGGNGYLAMDGDADGITSIVELVGVTDMAATDII